jgi:hypothetical protein
VVIYLTTQIRAGSSRFVAQQAIAHTCKRLRLPLSSGDCAILYINNTPIDLLSWIKIITMSFGTIRSMFPQIPQTAPQSPSSVPDPMGINVMKGYSASYIDLDIMISASRFANFCFHPRQDSSKAQLAF